MGTIPFALIVLSGVALYFMKPDERRQLLQRAVAWLREAIHGIRAGVVHDAFYEFLLRRTRWAIVTPVLVIFCTLYTMSAGFGDAAGMIEHGANYMPRTTNGEWGRLFSYSFVHGGLIHLVATIAALLSLGLILERLVGSIAFAAVYAASAIVSGAVALWTESATVTTAGASGAILGLYGLLFATIVYGYLRQPRLPFSPLAARRAGAGSVLFGLNMLFTSHLGAAAELAGLLTGLAAGFAIAGQVTERKPAIARAALIPAAVALVAFLTVLPLRGTIDARPVIARVVDVESRTASEYAKAVAAFTNGRMSAKALAQTIQRSILPALAADRARVEALRGVPAEQKPLVAAAHQYFELREQSWQRRIEGLLGSNMKTLREAEKAERAALDHFSRLQHDLGVQPVS